LQWRRQKWRLKTAGLISENLERRDRFGVIVSTGIGGLKTLQDQLTILLRKGPSRLVAVTIPMLIAIWPLASISMEFNLRGPNLCIVTACANRITPLVNRGEL